LHQTSSLSFYSGLKIPEALVNWPSVAIAIAAFRLIAWLKRDAALVALAPIMGGVLYAGARMVLD
jgi:hypothetical protein